MQELPLAIANLKNLDHEQTSDRKKDHINLAFESRVEQALLDKRFYYEPMLAAHPAANSLKPLYFLGKKQSVPMWVSSMTGGTAMAGIINRNLARACKEFGFGMGLGSCRIILDDDTYLPDFQLRDLIGDEQSFYANLGIAQVETLLENGQMQLIKDLVKKLDADGLIVHVNPTQEWLQPEGDRIKHVPMDTLKRLLDVFNGSVIVKEVGQGMGPSSLKALMTLPLQAIEFAANGGTNFAKLELFRADEEKRASFGGIPQLGHSAAEMVEFCNHIAQQWEIRCNEVIISGGVRDFLDGYYLIHKSKLPAVYGQASEMLKRAQGDYEVLQNYIQEQIRGLELATAYLKVR